MRKSSLSENLVDAIKQVIDEDVIKRPTSLHEPFFENTNAWLYLKDCLDTGWVSSNGSWVETFEKKICEVTNATYAVAVTNGTVGLRLALHLLGVKPNEEVIIPPLSFVATANAVSHLGAIPHFVDIETDTLGLCPIKLEAHLKQIALKRDGFIWNRKTNRRISAIVPVHVFGMPANICEIKKISKNWGIPLLEDAAEALGSYVVKNSRKVHCGVVSEIGVISFNGNKIITTGGGGVLLFKNKKLAIKAKHLSTTSKISHPWEFDHNQIGWNDRLPNLNAALGVSQLEDFQNRIKAKIFLKNKYQKVFNLFKEVELINCDKDKICNNWLITMRFLNKDIRFVKKERDNLLKLAHSNKIFLRPAWKPLHLLKMYKNSPKGDLSNIENQQYRIINLPSSPQLINR